MDSVQDRIVPLKTIKVKLTVVKPTNKHTEALNPQPFEESVSFT